RLLLPHTGTQPAVESFRPPRRSRNSVSEVILLTCQEVASDYRAARQNPHSQVAEKCRQSEPTGIYRSYRRVDYQSRILAGRKNLATFRRKNVLFDIGRVT